MPQTYITAAVEGDPDEAVARRLAAEANLEVVAVHGKKGKGYLDQKIRAFNAAAQRAPWLVMRDLDRDAPCPPELVQRLLPAPARQMVYRVVVHTVESWLFADRDALRRFLGVPLTLIPDRPDDVLDPKSTMIQLARRSRYADMAPPAAAPNRVGPAYNARLIEFVINHWRPRMAARNSESLRRCLAKLDAL